MRDFIWKMRRRAHVIAFASALTTLIAACGGVRPSGDTSEEARRDLAAYYDQVGLDREKWLEANAPLRVDLWKDAAGGGVLEAMVLLGFCHEKGCATPKDIDKALEYWSNAMEQGSSAGLMAFCPLPITLCTGNI
jgi:TPR repeat protein